MLRTTYLLCLSLMGLACADGGARRADPPATLETVWRGVVEITETRVFHRGSRLVLEPGTVVRFAHRDEDGDGWGDVSLQVEGDLIARGTPQEPIVFTSAAEPAAPGAWGEIRIDFGSFQLQSVVLEGSTRGLHSHFSSGVVRDSVFRWNVDGTRLGESAVTLEHNLFYGHPGKAYNSRRCRNTVVRNRFHHNRNALFLFEADNGSAFAANHFRHNQRPVRLGDFFEGLVHTRGNDWGAELPVIEEPTPDRALRTAPATVDDAGPRAWPLWDPLWTTHFKGFVDTAPTWSDEGIYVATWSGEVARLGFLDGSRQASLQLPDVVDAAVAVGGKHLAVTSWDRGIHLLERSRLRPLDSWFEEPSPADDHRQAAPLLRDGTLYAATWAGAVHAFDVSGNHLRPLWSHRAAGPFRAALSLAGDLLLAPCADGQLYALDRKSGAISWTFHAGAPLLSAPACDARRAYLADRDGQLWAVNLADGRTAWQAQLGGGAWYTPPLLHQGVLYQGDDSGTLTAVNANDGSVRWTRVLGAGIRARPAAVREQLAVPTLAGRLYLLDLGNGWEWDCWQVAEPSQASPAARGDRVIFAARDGSVRALQVRRDRP